MPFPTTPTTSNVAMLTTVGLKKPTRASDRPNTPDRHREHGDDLHGPGIGREQRDGQRRNQENQPDMRQTLRFEISHRVDGATLCWARAA